MMPVKTASKQPRGRGKGRPFPKGESGNPNGRPKKGYSITEMMQEMLGSEPEIKAALGKSVLKKALSGDMTAMKLVWSYMDGMPVQGLELGGVDGGPIVVITKVPLMKHDT